VAPVPAFVYVRSYIPPVTDRLVQQLSLLAPQSLRPGPLVWQLAIVVVEPEPPLLFEPPELDAELLEPLLLPLEPAELDPELPLPPLLLFKVAAPELLDAELPLDPELPPVPPSSLAPLPSTSGMS
jgi:hypothetical protein